MISQTETQGIFIGQWLGLIIGGVIPACLFGVSNLFSKMSVNAGISTSLYLFSISCGVFVAAVFCVFLYPEPNVVNFKSSFFAALNGFIWAFGTGLIALAMSKYQAPLSKLVPIYNMNTLIAVLLALVVFSEWQGLSITKLIIGSVLIVAGGVLVSQA